MAERFLNLANNNNNNKQTNKTQTPECTIRNGLNSKVNLKKSMSIHIRVKYLKAKDKLKKL